MTIGGYRVGPLLRKTGQGIIADDLTGLAAQVAYSFFFSIFPFLLIIGATAGLLVNGKQAADWILARIGDAVPAGASSIVSGVFRDLVFSDQGGILSVGVVLSLWSGSSVFRTLMSALNRAYNVPETRPFWKRALIAMAAIVGTGMVLLVASTITLAGPELASWIGGLLHLERIVVLLWQWLQFPLALALLVLTLFLIYRFIPNVRQKPRQILVGATVAAVLWIAITLLFRLYVTNFGSYNKTYGAIGAVMVLLTWMYLTMLVILAGGELNAELHHGTGALRPRAGAVYEERVVTSSAPSRASTDRPAPLRAGGSEHDGGAARG